jgi:hypothetical protein
MRIQEEPQVLNADHEGTEDMMYCWHGFLCYLGGYLDLKERNMAHGGHSIVLVSFHGT